MHVVDQQGETIYRCDKPEHGEHYWRRGAFSGHGQAQRLVDAGMGYWPTCTKPPWPEEEDYGVTENPDYDYDADPREWLGERVPEFQAAIHAYLKATYDEQPGISVYKLCGSNDGWWVTQIECESALKLWEQNGSPDVDEGLGDTIPFLRAAADHAGFRVF